jgi:hypothetical protein
MVRSRRSMAAIPFGLPAIGKLTLRLAPREPRLVARRRQVRDTPMRAPRAPAVHARKVKETRELSGV